MMVISIVTHLGERKPVCYALPCLREASDAHDRKDYVSAGCWLYEGTRRFLMSMCEAHGLKPAESLEATVSQLLEAEKLDDGECMWLRDCLLFGEQCQQCRYVVPSLLKTAANLLCLIVHSCPEIELPTRGGVV